MKERQAEKAASAVQTNNDTIAEAYFKEQVKSPGLFFCLNHAEEWNETEAFIRKVLQDYPNLKVLVYYTGGRMEQKPVAAHLLVTDKKDFNLFGKEKPVLKQWLEEQNFDLLIIFSRKENKRCKKLNTVIKARLRVGWSMGSEARMEDISLGKPGEKISYDTFYSELKKYFKQMNIKLLP
ncbi:hypothetical protein MNBD_BACTEROID07-830 [hydrothermal vent metagenome]|uniref:Uncharacterized protein n=1 Tax=hydrothermal vent metagenome TaxID=652676 RepID=A0A3B0UCJ8_9ZZZZ